MGKIRGKPIILFIIFCSNYLIFFAVNMHISNQHRMMIYTWKKVGFRCKQIKFKLAEREVYHSLTGIKKVVRKVRDLDSILNLPKSGRPRSARIYKNMNRVRDEYTKILPHDSPKRTPTILAKLMKISRTTVRRIIKLDLGMRPYKQISVQTLTQPQIHKRLIRRAVVTISFK